MSIQQLLWEASPWWILVCLLAGLLYAWLLYGYPNRLWTKATRYLLFAIRFIAVSLLCALLLEPYLRQITQYTEDPAFAIVVDNSLSMQATGTSADSLESVVRKVEATLQEKGAVSIISNTNAADSLNFTTESSDLGKLLTEVRNAYENKNLAGIVLLSDGLFNQGINPEYIPIPYPIYSIGAGDTTQQHDIILKNLYFNKIAYQGNKFTVEAEVLQQGLAPVNATLQVLHKGKIIQQKQLQFKANQALVTDKVILEAAEAGFQQYTFRISEVNGEYTTKNNVQTAYIEVIEGRQKILIAAASPHPDIAALRQAIERNQNYQTELVFPTLNQKPKEDRYDAIIFHGLPSRKTPNIAEYTQLSPGQLFIWTSSTYLTGFNQSQEVVNLSQQGQQTDQVFPALNNQFKLFTLPEEAERTLEDYPPTTVAYGDVQNNGQALLFQRIGRIVTDKPLLAINLKDDKRQAVLLNEGIWQWRIREAASETDQPYAPVLDDLLQKTIQLLATRKQDQEFKVYPTKNEALRNEGIIFETELYNQLYEPVYGQNIKLQIKDDAEKIQNFSYVNSSNGSRYEVNDLAPGIYSYSASTKLDNKTLTSGGTFTILDQQLELLDLTANHSLLKKLSEQSGGDFYSLANTNDLLKQLTKLETKQAILSNEEYKNVLELEWILVLILLLLTIEWFTRKYNGGY